MGSTASVLMLGAAAVAAIGAVGVWVALRRPTQALQRRQRDEALAAAALYTPAARVPPYGAPELDPCAPGLSDHERVDAMRALLLRGDRQAAAEGASATEPTPLRDEVMSTAPMAWKPTLPLEEAEVIESRRGLKLRVHMGDHEHISV